MAKIRKNSLWELEKKELGYMRAEILTLESMLQEGLISKQDYNIRLDEMSKRLATLEEKYGVR